MTGMKLHVRLYRDSFATPWGFRLQGGKDLNQPLVVQRVFCNSPAEGQLQRGDIIDAIGIKRGIDLSHKQAQDSLKHGGGQIELVITRPPTGTVSISSVPPNITPVSTRAPQQKPQMPQPKPYGYQPKKVTVSKYGGGPTLGVDYGAAPVTMQTRSGGYKPVDAGGYKPVEQYNMLNRVQGSLDNIILSPRTPEASPSQAPFYQPYEPYAPPPQSAPNYQYQEPQQQYRSTGERLDRMKEQQGDYSAPARLQSSRSIDLSTAARLEQLEPEDEENKVPVRDRRQAFTGPSSYMHEQRPIKPKRPPPKFRKQGASEYSNVGIDYAEKTGRSRPASGTWRPQQQSHHHHQEPINREPDATSYVHTPYEDGEPTVPAWRNTLKTSGIKPWEEDLNYGSRNPAPEVHQAPRHIKTIQIQLKQPTMQPMQPVKVTQKSPGSQKAPQVDGERDWTQSAVFRMVAQEEHINPGQQRGGGRQQQRPPPPAPKPSSQPAQFRQNQFQIPYDDEVGVSDF